MRQMLILASLLVAVLALQGCDISDVISSNQFDAVNLTVLGATYGTPLSADIHTPEPAHNYSTNGDGFVRLLAKYGQDVLTADIKFWTLPPSVWRQKTLQFRLSNKAVDYRVVLQDNPYLAAKATPDGSTSIIITTEFADGVERPAEPMRLTVERMNDAGNWEPAHIEMTGDSTLVVE